MHAAVLVGSLGAYVAASFQRGFQCLALAARLLELHFRRSYDLVLPCQASVDGCQSNEMQLRRALPFVFFQRLIALGGFRLLFQPRQLAFQFGADVAEPLQIFLGVADAVLRLATALAVFGDASGFLQIATQLVGLRRHQVGDHALLDDRVAARPKAGAKKDVGDVAASAACAVEVVDGLRIAIHFAANGQFGVTREFAANALFAVVEQQFDGGQRSGLTGVRAVEDDVGKRFATQLSCRTLAHHPAHRIDDVRFTAAVGAYDGNAAAR